MRNKPLIVVGLLAAGAWIIFQQQTQARQQLAPPVPSGVQVVPPGSPNQFGH